MTAHLLVELGEVAQLETFLGAPPQPAAPAAQVSARDASLVCALEAAGRCGADLRLFRTHGLGLRCAVCACVGGAGWK